MGQVLWGCHYGIYLQPQASAGHAERLGPKGRRQRPLGAAVELSVKSPQILKKKMVEHLLKVL